jgi:hypothetical protein
MNINEHRYLGQVVYIKMILYADNQVVPAKFEDKLQRNIFKLNIICNIYIYNFTISSNISKVTAFQGKKPIKLKIVLEDQIVDKLNHYNYRGCNISFENNNGIYNKISKVPKDMWHNKMKMKYEASRETQHIIYIFDGPCSVWFSHGL